MIFDVSFKYKNFIFESSKGDKVSIYCIIYNLLETRSVGPKKTYFISRDSLVTSVTHSQ